MQVQKADVRVCSAACLSSWVGHDVVWRGDVEVLGTLVGDYMTRGVAVVGARNVSERGRVLTQKLVAGLVESGFGVISGCARGVDMEAHREAVKLGAGSATMAVLPAGLGMGFGKELEGAVANGRAVLLSPYPTGHPARRWTFAHRNKLIAQMAIAMVVVEVGIKSGTMQSAWEMLKLKKPVFVMAVDPDSPTADGMVQLVWEGGILVNSVEQVIRLLDNLELASGHKLTAKAREITGGSVNNGSSVVSSRARKPARSSDYPRNRPNGDGRSLRAELLGDLQGDLRKCMKCLLQVGVADLGKISAQTGMNATELLPILTDLEMRGFIYQKLDNYYVNQN